MNASSECRMLNLSCTEISPLPAKLFWASVLLHEGSPLPTFSPSTYFAASFFFKYQFKYYYFWETFPGQHMYAWNLYNVINQFPPRPNKFNFKNCLVNCERRIWGISSSWLFCFNWPILNTKLNYVSAKVYKGRRKGDLVLNIVFVYLYHNNDVGLTILISLCCL